MGYGTDEMLSLVDEDTLEGGACNDGEPHEGSHVREHRMNAQVRSQLRQARKLPVDRRFVSICRNRYERNCETCGKRVPVEKGYAALVEKPKKWWFTYCDWHTCLPALVKEMIYKRMSDTGEY